MPLQLVEVPLSDRKLVERFIRVPWYVNREHHPSPHWVPPLLMDRRDYLNPTKNPFFGHVQAAFWLVRKDGRESFLAVGEGVVEVTSHRVAIVTDMAIPSENIDEAKVEEARQRAAARLQDKISDEEVATINASLARSLAQLKVKRRRHV